MKNFLLLSVPVVALFATSCSKTDETMDAINGISISHIEAYIDNSDTRTSASMGDDGSIQMLWSAGDEIVVSDLNKSAQFKINSGVGTIHGKFSGSIISTSSTMYAVSPASSVTNIEGAIATVSIPNIQSFNASAEGNVGARNLMAGYTNNASLFEFFPIAAIARFDIEVGADEKICSVVMRADDACLSGVASLDLQSRVMGEADRSSVTLNYTDPATGTSSDGWVLIAPINFTAVSGKVYYDITTNRGKYTFCRKPTKPLLGGKVYRFPLKISAFEQVSSKSALADGKYYFESNSNTLTVYPVRSTDTTITVAWSNFGFPDDYSADAAISHKIALYDERNQLLVAWRPNKSQCVTSDDVFPYSESNNSYPPRFVFTGLTPNTNYKVQVTNLENSKKSAMTSISTAPVDCGEVVPTAINEGDIILFENFGKLVWNGDATTLAAGYVYKNYSAISNYLEGVASGDWTSDSQTTYAYCRRGREQQLFRTYASTVASYGLGDWAWWRNSSDTASSTSCAVLANAGYLKIGVTAVRSGVVTPELSALLGKAKVKITFKAASYGTTSVSDSPAIGVSAIDNCTIGSYQQVIASTYVDGKTFNLANDLKWHTYSVELSNITPTTRILFYGAATSVVSANNRFNIDDIRVELVEYGTDVKTDVPIVQQVAVSPYSATIEWTEMPQDTRRYTVALYTDAACTNRYEIFTTTISKSTTYIEWPARFTFQYLQPNTAYYATVTAIDGTVSNPVKVITTEEHTSDANEVLYEGFDRLYWGGDYMNMANGITLSGVSVGTYAPETIDSALSFSIAASSPTTDASRLSAYSDTMRSLMGLGDWESDAAFVRPGFIKLGTASAGGWLSTAPISNLSNEHAEITVSFKACPFVDGATAQTDHMYVRLLDKNGAEKEFKTFYIGGRRSQPGWESFTTTFTDVATTDRVQFASENAANSRVCLDDIHITSSSAITGVMACGYITDTNGTPLEGIVVSDGFSCVQTNSNGYYLLVPSSDTWYIYYSLPADCKVNTNSYGQPCFFERYYPTRRRYDFVIEKLPGGAEKTFNLFCLADPQCRSTTHISRFKNETVPDIKAHAASLSAPTYGVTLGDVAYSSGTTNTNPLMPSLRDAMNVAKTGIPIFQTMGNHDYTYFDATTSLSADETSSTWDLKAQREFETIFGPINYSWNRGDVHIVCMRDIIYTNKNDASVYTRAFTNEQLAWLRQDLSFVPKSKMVILCLHIPLVNATTTNVQNVISLLKQYTNSQIMTGHTHYMRNEPTLSGGVYEHVHAAVCGAWWQSSLNGDGCPNGYGVYTISGTTIKDWYYKGVNTGMNDRSYQLRLYRGNLLSGGKYEYFKQQHSSNVLLASVFNADSNWTVKVYEDDVYTGNMTLIPNKRYTDSTLPAVSTVSQTNPTLVPTNSSQDWWAIGFHVGVVGRGHSGGNRDSYLTNCFHIYKYTLKNTSASSIRVVATDSFGHQYTATEVLGDLEYPYAAKP